MQGLVLVVVLALIVVVGTTLGRRWSVAPPVLTTEVGLAALPGVAEAIDADAEAVDRLRSEYETRLERLRDPETAVDDATARYPGGERDLRLRVLQHKRQAATDLRDANEIDDLVLRELQTALDVEETRLRGEPLSEE